ncbi:LOW QUALITY PROTEIN: uncharacterized protein LOC133198871 [Saccostrea echinata]|uniref:LOW QUALITY PROTEIN: uncharacterized protein LOC133198871 n=1 Tax=Saccostrea echinata TaxID=191078 RepID=UPI002A7F1DA8|nr:LOW QUALITY PROTEIN: uncharacterized protein LOC133198871 [Saccostrea echinata]
MGKEGTNTNRKRKLEVDFSCEGLSQTKKPRLSEENLILSTFRENFPEKFQKFEMKMKTSSESSFSKPSDETPNSKPSDETPNSKPTEEISNNSTISTSKPTDEDSANQEIDYSPQSPELFLPAPTTHEYLLQPELLALSELVNSMRVDLLQTSTLINYIQDYLSRLDFRK